MPQIELCLLGSLFI
jgi:hypothetical protein